MKRYERVDEKGDVTYGIEYEPNDRVVVTVDGGQVGATVRFVDDNSLRVFLDSAEGVYRKVDPSAVVHQADTGEVGRIEYLKPVREGWKKPPARPHQMELGTVLRCCPTCLDVLSGEDEKAGACYGCEMPVERVFVVSVESVEKAG